MEYVDTLDEVLFKFVSLFLRFFQFFASVFIVGAVGQFLRDISGEGYAPRGYFATIGIASASILWSFFILLFTCCAGQLLLVIEATLDTIFLGTYIASTVLLNDDAIQLCSTFANKYFKKYGNNPPYQNDCGLVKAAFAFSVLNILAYVLTLTISVSVELIRQRRRTHPHHHHDTNHDQHQHHHHHHHYSTHQSF